MELRSRYIGMMVFLILLHVALYSLDEHYFNKKRDHSKFETISVVLDGILFLIPMLMATFIDFDEKWVLPYKLAGALSMISVVKNEVFHKILQLRERLTHACLYVLHPIILFTFYESWKNDYFNENPNFWMLQLAYVGFGIKTVTYQLIYWNYVREKKS